MVVFGRAGVRFICIRSAWDTANDAPPQMGTGLAYIDALCAGFA